MWGPVESQTEGKRHNLVQWPVDQQHQCKFCLPTAVAQEKLGPFQLRLMLDNDVQPQIEWLAARGLLKNNFDLVAQFHAVSSPNKIHRMDGGGNVVNVTRDTVQEGSFLRARFP